MKRREFEDKIIDYLDGVLRADEHARFERAMSEDENLRKIFDEYRAVCGVAKELKDEQFEIGAGFEVKVMERIEEVRHGVVKRLFMAVPFQFKHFAGTVATVATLVLILKMSSETSDDSLKHVSRPVPPAATTAAHTPGAATPAATLVPPLAHQGATETGTNAGPNPTVAKPSPETIPPGYRAVTIEVPTVSGVEGWARPGTKVDTILTLKGEDGKMRSQILTSTATIISSAYSSQLTDPSTPTSGKSTVTLVLPENDALKVRTAQQIGQLNLSLRGDDDSAPDASTVTFENFMSSTSASASGRNEAPTNKGYARIKDRDGSERQFVLGDDDRWQSDEAGVGTESIAAAPKPEEKFEDPEEKFKDLVRAFKDDIDQQKGSNTRKAVGAFAANYHSSKVAEPAARQKPQSGTVPANDSIRPKASSPANAEPVPNQYGAGTSTEKRQYDYLSDGRLRDSYLQHGSFAPPPPSPSDTGEQYIQYEESNRTATVQEPMTTFGVDVDTASYTNARRFLSLGQLPPPQSVRIEEMLNYFNYDYPTERERPFGVNYEIAPSPLEPGRHLLRFAIKARELKEAVKPWNLVFLVDVSGSMSDKNKLALVKSGLRALVGKMRPTDRVAIVTYAGYSQVALESTSLQQKDRIIAAIDSLSAGGGTNGEGGIRKAYEIAESNRIADGVNRVVLATDGDFNVGVTSHEALIQMIEEKRRSGVSLTTLGVGTGNIHDGTLEQLANKGNGNYFYLDTVQEARRVLEENVFGTMEIVAKDVKLQVEFNPAVVAQYRLIGYDNRKLENYQFNDDTVDSGEIGSGHAVTALYEITLVDSPLAKSTEYRYREKAPQPEVKSESTFSDELGFLKIRFKAPESNQSELLEFPLTRASVRARVEDSSDDFRFAAAVSYFGHLLRHSKFSGSYSYADIAGLAEKSRGADADGKRREFVELVRNASVGR